MVPKRAMELIYVKQRLVFFRFFEEKRLKMKKSCEKLHAIQKIGVPLQRFKEQLIVLQVLKSRKEMKKLAFLFATVVAVSFASCGQKTEQATCCDCICSVLQLPMQQAVFFHLAQKKESRTYRYGSLRLFLLVC